MPAHNGEPSHACQMNSTTNVTIKSEKQKSHIACMSRNKMQYHLKSQLFF